MCNVHGIDLHTNNLVKPCLWIKVKHIIHVFPYGGNTMYMYCVLLSWFPNIHSYVNNLLSAKLLVNDITWFIKTRKTLIILCLLYQKLNEGYVKILTVSRIQVSNAIQRKKIGNSRCIILKVHWMLMSLYHQEI
jgi:hypothetical protein